MIDQSSESSSQDQDAILLTPKVQYKLLSTVAKLRALRNDKKLKNQVMNLQYPIFDDSDFSDEEFQKNIINNKNKEKIQKNKYTYKKMLQQQQQQNDQQQKLIDQNNLPPVLQQKRARQKFKQAIKSNINNNDDIDQQQDLFKIKKSKKMQNNKEDQQQQQKKQKKILKKNKTEKDKFNQLLSQIKKDKKSKQNTKLVQKVWGNDQALDQTDLFLKRYILDKKWLSKNLQTQNVNLDNQKKKEQEMIDQEDQQRSVQMDRYEAQYNFRYQEPDGNKITFYPREIPQSMRIKPQSRKDKRKALLQRKKEEQKNIRQQAQKRRQQLKQTIINKLTSTTVSTNKNNNEQKMNIQQQQQDQHDHDWFFCDDCGKGLVQKQNYFVCYECQEYILCTDCFQLIIHTHQMQKAKVPKGFGAPQQKICQKMVSQLKTCTKCRKKIQNSKNRYEYLDKNYITNTFCQKCYDNGNLQIKKKYKLIEGQINLQNPDQIEELLENDPGKIKELTSQQDIQKLVDEYIQNEFQDVLADGTKAKFRYISVKPQSYGLSDQQILFGDDKQLNNYVSIKKLVPYKDQYIKLRNNIYNQKIKNIKKSVKQNKRLLKKSNNMNPSRNGLIKRGNVLKQLKAKSQFMKAKRQMKKNQQKQQQRQKIRIINLSNPQQQKKKFISSSRLASYGIPNPQ